MADSLRKSARSDSLDPFDDRVDMLFDELELAVKWDRPSILLAVYRSEYVQADVERILNARLSEIGIDVVHYLVNEDKFDLPLELIKQPDLEKTVFFVSGLKWGGGRSGGNSFRALNIRREYLVDYKIRAIFWLTEEESVELPFRAPDFWSFRHRVIEFIDAPAVVFSALVGPLRPARSLNKAPIADIDEKIKSQETLLSQLPANTDSTSERVARLLGLGNLYWLKGDLDRAGERLSRARLLSRAVCLVDLQFRALIGLGVVYDEAGLFAESISAFRGAARVDPLSFIPWLYLSLIYSRLGETRRALYTARKANRLNPRSAEAWFRLGNLYSEGSRFEEAVPAFQKSLALEKKNPEAWGNLGKIYMHSGKMAAAVSAFEKAARLEPQNGETLGQLSLLYRDLGDIQKACKTAKKAVKKSPHRSLGWIVLGSILAFQGQLEDSICAYTRAAEIDSHDPLAAISLADCYQKSGEMEQFIHWVSLATSLLTLKDDYVVACFRAVSRDGDNSLKLLKTALRKKQVSIDWLRRDPIFAFLHADKGFQRLLRS
jgi:tetratricopeptide (TPR) repeat protein